jgi:hypothetical protein
VSVERHREHRQTGTAKESTRTWDARTVHAVARLGHVLSHPSRIAMLALLATEGRTLAQLQRALRITRPQALHHLRQLNDENLLEWLHVDHVTDVEPTFTLKPEVRDLVLTLPGYAAATRQRTRLQSVGDRNDR